MPVPGPVSSAMAAGARVLRNTANCAIVLEDQPTGIDARMPFQFFEPEIEESYALKGYQEYAEKRMPQPGYAAYRGGNWSAMNLTLHFRATADLRSQIQLGQVGVADVEGVLLDMERKIRWFEALGFPLRRTAGAFADRQIKTAKASGVNPTAATQAALKNQVRNDPPIFLVVFGSFLTIRGYLENISLKWMPPFHPVSVRPYGCTVTMAIQRIEAEFPTWRSIRNSAGSSESSPVNIAGTVGLNASASRDLAGARAQASLSADPNNVFTQQSQRSQSQQAANIAAVQ